MKIIPLTNMRYIAAPPINKVELEIYSLMTHFKIKNKIISYYIPPVPRV